MIKRQIYFTKEIELLKGCSINYILGDFDFCLPPSHLAPDAA